MTHLLDTNAVIALLKGLGPVVAKARALDPSRVALPAVVWHELTYGGARSARPLANRARLDAMRLAILPLDARDAETAGSLRADLAARGTPIGPLDTLIAGQALARDLTLVTHNTREFARVEGLVWEDWEMG